MIILSQDKKHIRENLDLDIIEVPDDKDDVVEYYIVSAGDWIGSYKTEERAKEVLEEIYATYSGTEMFKIMFDLQSRENIYNTLKEYNQTPFTFEMPLE